MGENLRGEQAETQQLQTSRAPVKKLVNSTAASHETSEKPPQVRRTDAADSNEDAEGGGRDAVSGVPVEPWLVATQRLALKQSQKVVQETCKRRRCVAHVGQEKDL